MKIIYISNIYHFKQQTKIEENQRKRYKSALQAEGRRFESVNAHLKIKDLQERVSPFFV